ncbi:MAG: primosomal protein N' [Clostridia bacterium]|nr:primosomal protein N' [Clostridia bacterium]
MYAQVVISHTSRALDKILEYKIPEGMTVHVGDAVMVPFGAKNKPTQGYVTAVTQTADFDERRIKSIKALSPAGRVFDEKMLKVILFMRSRYLCTYPEAVAAVVPAGISSKSKEWITAAGSGPAQAGRKKEVFERVLASGGTIEYQKLINFFPWDSSQVIRELVKEGVLCREYSERAPVRKKTEKALRLAVSRDEALEAAEDFRKKAPKRARALEIMADAGFLACGDLKKFADCDSSVIKALCQKGFCEEAVAEIERNPNTNYVKPDSGGPLNLEQREAVDTLCPYIDEKKYETFLLHGVTGSGKTEVYMHCIKRVTDMGRKAIVLVPEISLTPQTVNRFRARFGDRIAVLHSALSPGEKYDQWRKIRDGGADIVIGARSAVFAPFDDIGIIVLDEEHSDTYKSESSPRYVTNEIAAFRAQQNGALLLLGSATPSFETYYKACSGEIRLLNLKQRFNMNSMPDIFVEDMREELASGNKTMFSRRLYEEISLNLEKGEQTILFLNRRGYSTFVSCRECGYVVHCPNCNISLTYHRHDDTLQCHYCGHSVKNYTVCPSCGSKYIRYFGGGTEKVESEVKRLFPNASTIRMDIDTTGKKQSHRKILERFEKEKTDILIGTQMVTKGLDFENVTLVGVISADTMLHVDDFRSGERTFDILEQVTGRAGRGEKRGRAVIQTYSPDHEAIIMAAQHNYLKYYQDEIRMRKILWYPPFCDIILIGFSGGVRQDTDDCSKAFRAYVGKGDFTVLGPLPCAVSKIKNKYRFQILIKCSPDKDITDRLVAAREKCRANLNFEDVTIIIDKNPVHIH